MLTQEELRSLFTYKDGRLFNQDGSPVKMYKFKSHTKIRIRVNGKYYGLHRCIWAYHKGDLLWYERPVVEQKDGNPENNRIENLHLRYLGSNCKRKLKPEDVEAICNLYPTLSGYALAEHYKVSRATISNVVTGNYPRRLPGQIPFTTIPNFVRDQP